MRHPDGIDLPEPVLKTFKNQVEHDPTNLAGAREFADQNDDLLPIGLFYRNIHAQRYDAVSATGLEMSPPEKIAAVNKALDQFMV
jgi:hypothetical protein